MLTGQTLPAKESEEEIRPPLSRTPRTFSHPGSASNVYFAHARMQKFPSARLTHATPKLSEKKPQLRQPLTSYDQESLLSEANQHHAAMFRTWKPSTTISASLASLTLQHFSPTPHLNTIKDAAEIYLITLKTILRGVTA